MSDLLNGGKCTARVASIVFGLILCSVTGSLYAQTATGKKKAATNIMEEIVVTGRKQTESLQSAPVAISVITPNVIKNAGISNVNNIGANLPNVSSIDEPAALTGNGFAPFIRGMRSASRQIGEESGLGIFIDGAYAGNNDNGNRFLPPVQQVEFLPGPQATLFGKNTTLGVLNIITKKPGNQLDANVTASIGNDGHRTLIGTVMGPVSDSVSMGLTLGKRMYNGFEVNHNAVNLNDGTALYPASNYPGVADGLVGPRLRAWGGTFQLAYRGNTNRLDVEIDHSDNKRTNQFDAARVGGYDALPIDTYNTSDPGSEIGRETGATVTYDQDVGTGKVTSITAYRKFHVDNPADDDTYPWRVVWIPVWITNQKQFSQELRWSQDFGSVKYLAGLYYLHQNLYTRRGGNVMELTPNLQITGEMKNKTVAAFANTDIHLNNTWGLEFGARVGKEDKALPFFTQSGASAIGLWSGLISDSRSTTKLSYTAAITFAPTDNLNTHFRYSRGYKSGGFTIDFVTTATPPPFYEFADEQADNFELGTKWAVNDRLWVNVVLFDTNYTNLQVSQLLTIPGSSTPFFATGNAGKAVTRGIETTVVYNTDNLTLNASFGYNDAHYTKWMRPSGNTVENMAGRKMPSPRVTFNLLGSYDIAAWTLIAEYQYRGDHPATPGQPVQDVGDAVKQINLRARYHITDHWTASLWVKNLTDERAVLSRSLNVQGGFIHDYAGIFYPTRLTAVTTPLSGSMQIGSYQPPRQYGLDVEYKF